MATPSLPPGELILVGTPIGNLEDITTRALTALREADIVMAEDTRHSRKLLDRYEIQQRMVSCHKFNEASRIDWVAEQLEGGQTIAYITDGGMPGVSDPGSRLVQGIQERGLPVSVRPGPSAVSSAVALSGLCEYGYQFLGFLKPKSAARKRELTALADSTIATILFESPHRILKLLAEASEILPDRACYIGRELTKKFEESLWGTPGEILARFDGRSAKGEFVVVIAAAPKVKRSKATNEYQAN